MLVDTVNKYRSKRTRARSSVTRLVTEGRGLLSVRSVRPEHNANVNLDYDMLSPEQDEQEQRRLAKNNKQNVVSEIEKRQLRRMIPTLYDFRTLSKMQRTFQRWRPLSSLDEPDGVAMGKLFMERMISLRHRVKMGEKARRER